MGITGLFGTLRGCGAQGRGCSLATVSGIAARSGAATAAILAPLLGQYPGLVSCFCLSTPNFIVLLVSGLRKDYADIFKFLTLVKPWWAARR